MGTPNPHVPRRRKYHASCGRTRSGRLGADRDSVAASWLIHNHPCCWFAILFFFGSIHAVSALIYGKAMHFVLNSKVFQLAEVIRIVLLKNRNRAAVTSDVNPFEPGIVFDDVAIIG